MFEHTYNSGLSQYYAVIVWAASCLYQAGETPPRPANTPESCWIAREQGAAGMGLTGFFLPGREPQGDRAF